MGFLPAAVLSTWFLTQVASSCYNFCFFVLFPFLTELFVTDGADNNINFFPGHFASPFRRLSPSCNRPTVPTVIVTRYDILRNSIQSLIYECHPITITFASVFQVNFVSDGRIQSKQITSRYETRKSIGRHALLTSSPYVALEANIVAI